MAYTSRVGKGVRLSTIELDNNFLCHYPVGSLYINALKNESPGELIGYGKWSKFAQGYVLVASDSPNPNQFGDRPDDEKSGNSPDYYSPGVTGGSPSVKVSSWVEHTHEWEDTTYQGTFYDGRHRMQGTFRHFRKNSVGEGPWYQDTGNTASTTAGDGLQHNNLQEYITVNIWKRTQ